MIDSVPLIQNPNDAQQINASIIAMKKASRELDEKIVKLNNLNSELDKKIALLDSGLNKEIEDRKEAINSLDVSSVGGSGKYISAISETDGKISATVSDLTSVIESGNNQPVTSGGVATAIDDVLKNQKTYEFFTPDNIRYVLMQDISTWYNSTSSSVVQSWVMNGMLVARRTGGYDRSEIVNLTLSVGHFRNNQSLPNSNLMHVNSFCLNNFIQACIVRYNSKEYLALKILENQARNYFFIGYCTSTPLFTRINLEQTITELFNGGRTVTDGIVQNSPNLITSGSIYWLRRGLLHDTGLLNLTDNAEQTVTLNASRMYLFINIHAMNGQELIILNCYDGFLRQTRITHAQRNNDTTITNSGQNVTFKSTGGCRGYLLLLTDFTST